MGGASFVTCVTDAATSTIGNGRQHDKRFNPIEPTQKGMAMATTILQVGDQIPDLRHAQRYLPLGTVIHTGGTSIRHRLVAPGTWLTNDHNEQLMDPYIYNYSPVLASMPDSEPDPVVIPETTAQFRWRLRDTALTAAHVSRVVVRNVESCLARLEAGASNLPLGQGVHLSNLTDIRRLPNDSLLYCGHPSQQRGFGLFRVFDGTVSNVLGRITFNESNVYPMVVYRAGPAPAWLTAEPGPDDDLNLSLLKAKAWTVGMAGKHQNSWCSVLESTLHRLGISSASPSEVGELPYVAGDVLSYEQVARLPQGSVLGWVWGNGTSYITLYRRVDTARNRAGTARLWGTDPGGSNSHQPMTYLGSSTTNVTWRVRGRDLLALPNGTAYLSGGERFNLTEATRRSIEHWNTYEVVALTWTN